MLTVQLTGIYTRFFAVPSTPSSRLGSGSQHACFDTEVEQHEGVSVIDGWFTTMRFLADESGTTRWFANRYWVATRSDGAAAAPPTASPEERDAIWRQARESTPPAAGRRAWDDNSPG